MSTRIVADRPRRACTRCEFVHFPDPKVGVGVLVVHDGRVLLVRRVMEPEAGRWGLPGGYLDAGEDPRQAAAREAAEEAGIRVRVGPLVEVVVNPPGSGASLFLLYEATYLDGAVCAGDDADGAGFFGPTELPDLAFASTRAALRRVFDAAGSRPG